MNENKYVVPVIILSFTLLISVVMLSYTWKGNRKINQTITVTGSAKKEIVADIGFLRGSINARGATAELAFNDLNSQKPVLINYLESKGFAKDKIEFFTVNNYPVYEIGPNGISTNRILEYNYSQRIEIQSNDVNKIKEISLDISSLVSKGVNFNVENPEYYYSKLADLKIEIQAEAAKDAKNRAEKIAEATGRNLGVLTNARMGVLQITPKFSNMISDYGMNDVSSIEKEITAVVSASFEIE